MLNKAIDIATKAHSGQVDKAGQPYITHPLRVMSMGATDDEKIVGVLHDVVEDSDWTFDRLAAEGFAVSLSCRRVSRTISLSSELRQIH